VKVSIKLGFAILSHDHPEQLFRLVKTLTAMFDAPPIICHHNFTQCPLHSEVFPSNVRFVIPHIDTKWGHINLPLAALKAFGQLRSHAKPDWFVLLSGSDYPVRCADEIVRDLDSTTYDAFLDHREIQYNKVPPGQVEQHGFGRPDWIKIAYNRYCTYRFWLPFPSRKLLYSGSFPFWKKPFLIRDPRIIQVLNRFQHPLRVYGGDFWFQANHKAVDRLLDCSLDKLVRYYYKREIPEESVFQTHLCNQADLKICAKYKRYSDWTYGGAHPKWLDVSDLPLILASQAHFARKFRPNGTLQEFIDKTVLRL
jgi:hypothetical protein